MSSILTSQGVVLATAMAVSGTVILLALRLQKSFPAAAPPTPRPCISSASEGKKRFKKKKKRVHFAKDVVDPAGNSEEFRRQHGHGNSGGGFSVNSAPKKGQNGKEIKGMPANRAALYNGILRDRLVPRRLAYCY
ncbi:uncharacterized protein LOC127805772 [Diospyros lotus]|uniref:uncharacterized protein LOC127805772 n=1 Tax=Diospyros lotus TaxID=55363 RepID=UPI0022550047|nr:uncharacterized protein LOC127805772 [Diospyros lotus]